MKKLICVYLILFAVSIYSQQDKPKYGVSDYQVIRYYPADTTIILEANYLHVSDHKPFMLALFNVSLEFRDKYPAGSIFNYVVCRKNENYIRLIKYKWDKK